MEMTEETVSQTGERGTETNGGPARLSMLPARERSATVPHQELRCHKRFEDRAAVFLKAAELLARTARHTTGWHVHSRTACS